MAANYGPSPVLNHRYLELLFCVRVCLFVTLVHSDFCLYKDNRGINVVMHGAISHRLFAGLWPAKGSGYARQSEERPTGMEDRTSRSGAVSVQGGHCCSQRDPIRWTRSAVGGGHRRPKAEKHDAGDIVEQLPCLP
ncbi:unnamed protein product [Schistocephalus solidus]|uniref:Secreted protein n=1 Tax=Schistocephalus solidus TaxID=70667 RepID=A0A183TEL2_SCHSO|nr:unnamed protein product [Schistocephalus solidus]